MRADPAMLGKPAFERLENDAYFTLDAEMAVEALMETGMIAGRVLEPAAGRGHLVVELRRHCLEVEARDLYSHADPLVPIVPRADLMNLRDLTFHDALVTNLPYDRQHEMLRHLLPIAARDHCAVAVLSRSSWYYGKAARALTIDFERFAGIKHLPRRPWWSEQRTSSPRHDYAWLIWSEFSRAGRPVIF